MFEKQCWVHHWIGQSDMNTKLNKSNNFIKSLLIIYLHLDLCNFITETINLDIIFKTA